MEPLGEVMAERLRDINPALTVHTYADRLQPDALPEYLAASDFTIDCIDDVRAKVALACWHIAHDKPLVSSMGTGNKLGTQPFQIADISKTAVCPLARAVRLALRKQGITKGLTVLYSEEPAFNKPPEGEKPGTICFAPAMAGLQLARYVTEALLK